MSDSTTARIDEHRMRQQETEQESQAERDSTERLDLEGSLPSPDLLLRSNLGRRANAPTRIAAMQSAQQTYGNRAVQRFMSGGSNPAPREGGPVAVQRYRPPDENWQDRRREAAFDGISNQVSTIPVLGNVWSLLESGGAVIDAAVVDDPKESERFQALATQKLFHAIPGIGNISAARDAAQDWGAYGQLGNGAATPPQTSRDRWESETAPNLGKFLRSLF